MEIISEDALPKPAPLAKISTRKRQATESWKFANTSAWIQGGWLASEGALRTSLTDPAL
jgi:hypothetical protein